MTRYRVSAVVALIAGLLLAYFVWSTETFRLTVNYARTLDEMIAAGRYDWGNDDITPKRFPIDGKGTAELKATLFLFNRDISSENAIEEMRKTGYEPAKIEHLLAFGEKYPEEQHKFLIVALGSVAEVDGHRSVPYLRRIGSGRHLNLDWFDDDDWPAGFRFLAVRKVSAP